MFAKQSGQSQEDVAVVQEDMGVQMLTEENIMQDSSDEDVVEDEIEMLLVGGSDDYTDSLGSIDETVEVLGIGRDDEEKPLVIQSLQQGAPGSNESTDEDAVKDEIGVRLSGVPDCYTDSL